MKFWNCMPNYLGHKFLAHVAAAVGGHFEFDTFWRNTKAKQQKNESHLRETKECFWQNSQKIFFEHGHVDCGQKNLTSFLGTKKFFFFRLTELSEMDPFNDLNPKCWLVWVTAIEITLRERMARDKLTALHEPAQYRNSENIYSCEPSKFFCCLKWSRFHRNRSADICLLMHGLAVGQFSL